MTRLAGTTGCLCTIRATAGDREAIAEARVRTDEPQPDGDDGDEPIVKPGKRVLRWRGTVPPQKWMNFYTKVLTRFAGSLAGATPGRGNGHSPASADTMATRRSHATDPHWAVFFGVAGVGCEEILARLRQVIPAQSRQGTVPAGGVPTRRTGSARCIACGTPRPTSYRRARKEAAWSVWNAGEEFAARTRPR
jgi:hypothetical protein